MSGIYITSSDSKPLAGPEKLVRSLLHEPTRGFLARRGPHGQLVVPNQPAVPLWPKLVSHHVHGRRVKHRRIFRADGYRREVRVGRDHHLLEVAHQARGVSRLGQLEAEVFQLGKALEDGAHGLGVGTNLAAVRGPGFSA